MLNVFNIQRYSIHDGEGVRTNIFFKGCPLRCHWCNNPEGIDPSPSLMFDERLCQKFGDCMKPGNNAITAGNGAFMINLALIPDITVYRNVCPSLALVVTGEEKSVSQILKEIEKDIPFYRNREGGVTLTGGEPLLQGPDLKDLILELKKRNIHIAVETSLHLPWETIEIYTEFVDVFLADLKHTNELKFSKFTGGNATLVMNNFQKLDQSGSKFVVRVPVIPGFNFSPSELYTIIDFAAALKNAKEIDFIPYHSLAKEKYLMMGKIYQFGKQRNINKTELTPYAEYAEHKGLAAKILN
jgi:pyruvate formate lyase activating enzyme